MESYFTATGISFQLVPPDSHRTNDAERAMRTWKDHFEGTLAVADPSFPLVQSAHLVVHAETTLNMMRASRIAPHVSAWELLPIWFHNAHKLFGCQLRPE